MAVLYELDCSASFDNYQKNLRKIIMRSFDKVFKSELKFSVGIMAF